MVEEKRALAISCDLLPIPLDGFWLGFSRFLTFFLNTSILVTLLMFFEDKSSQGMTSQDFPSIDELINTTQPFLWCTFEGRWPLFDFIALADV